LGGLTGCVRAKHFEITVGRAACEACRATWNLGTNSAFALGPRKTETVSRHLVLRIISRHERRREHLPHLLWNLRSCLLAVLYVCRICTCLAMSHHTPVRLTLYHSIHSSWGIRSSIFIKMRLFLKNASCYWGQMFVWKFVPNKLALQFQQDWCQSLSQSTAFRF
jgi:hypothetical protein